MISAPDIQGAKTLWELLWYSGIAGGMIVLLWYIVQGKLVPRIHHDWVIAELSRDRDEWRDHANELKTAVDRLAETRGRR